ncbi:MAG: zinc metalloprotease HtpX [Thermoplasmatota archaeon]
MGYRAKTGGLLAFMMIFMVGIGYLLGGYFMGNWILGTLIFLIIAAVMNLVSYFYSHKFILKHYNAHPIQESDNPNLFSIVKEVAFEADIKMPKVAILPMSVPNAFATGRNEDNAVVAVSEGLLSILNDDEVKGVISHEVAHIKNRDMLVMSIAATLAGAVTFMARMVWWQMLFSRRRMNPIFLVTMILAPIGAIIIKLAISRKREFHADEEGARISKNPNALADALEKLEVANRKNPLKKQNPTTASLFIVNPFTKSAFVKLFSTHPPIEDRVENLRKMAVDFSYL